MVVKTLRDFSLTIAIVTPIFGLLNVSSARAVEREFTIINQTNLNIVKIYISAANTHRSAEDVLGRGILATGNTTRVQVVNDSPSCYHNLRAIFSDGQVWESHRLNLCDLNSYTFTN